jgi:hypothetical protein
MLLRYELTEAHRQQTTLADVLEVISSSPGELEPVFETMLANAARPVRRQVWYVRVSTMGVRSRTLRYTTRRPDSLRIEARCSVRIRKAA